MKVRHGGAGAPSYVIARVILMFLWSDAWLLLSLIYAREPAGRDHLRAVGDYINHAIFTDEELEGGLDRLLRAGHAFTNGDQFGPSPQALAWYASVTTGKARTAVHKDVERVERFLGVGDNA